MELDRQVQTIVSQAARGAKCTQRVKHLSIPKKSFLKSWYFIDSRLPEEPITKISASAKKCTATPRIESLSTAKLFHREFRAPNLRFWNVRRSAMAITCPERSSELAKPITRSSIDHVNYNPHAFVVTAAAKTAVCSPRVDELSIPKKKTTKK